MFKCFITFASLAGLNILAKSEKWWSDGTLKSSPQLFYQHYIIHGKVNGWALPGCFSFLTGKSKEIYSQMLTNLKETAMAELEVMDYLMQVSNYVKEFDY